MTRPKRIRRGNEPIPALVAWMQKHPNPNANGMFERRAFPITTKELAAWLAQRPVKQRELF